MCGRTRLRFVSQKTKKQKNAHGRHRKWRLTSAPWLCERTKSSPNKTGMVRAGCPGVGPECGQFCPWRSVHHHLCAYRRKYYSLLQNTFVVSTVMYFWYRFFRPIPFIRYEKGCIFSIGCCQSIPKIIIGVGCQPTPLSLVQIENIIWIHYETRIFFKFRIHSNIYTIHS
jgi:hypothetical protein